MRVAMGIELDQKSNRAGDKSFITNFQILSTWRLALQTLVRGQTILVCPTVSLMEIQDEMEHIGKTVSDVLLLSKATGGISFVCHPLAGRGFSLKSNNTISSGPVPFMHIIDSAVRAVQRGGKKRGTVFLHGELAFNFQDFLDLKQNNGDDYRRTRTANTAVYISDEFMKRVAEWGRLVFALIQTRHRTLWICMEKLFFKRYNEYVEMAEVR